MVGSSVAEELSVLEAEVICQGQSLEIQGHLQGLGPGLFQGRTQGQGPGHILELQNVEDVGTRLQAEVVGDTGQGHTAEAVAEAVHCLVDHPEISYH